MKKKPLKIITCIMTVAVIISMFSANAFAAGDVATAIEQT